MERPPIRRDIARRMFVAGKLIRSAGCGRGMMMGWSHVGQSNRPPIWLRSAQMGCSQCRQVNLRSMFMGKGDTMLRLRECYGVVPC